MLYYKFISCSFNNRHNPKVLAIAAVDVHINAHGVIERVLARSSVAQKMIWTVRARTAYLLKSRLSLISVPVYGLNL